MSTINGLGGPRMPTLSPSTTQGPSGSSFLSRVRMNTSGSVSLPTGGPAVSGKSVVSSAISAATGGQPAVSPEQKTIQDMSRSFVMSMAQTTFGDVAQCKAEIEPEDG